VDLLEISGFSEFTRNPLDLLEILKRQLDAEFTRGFTRGFTKNSWVL